MEDLIKKTNPYPEYLERSHSIDGSEEKSWENRNKALLTLFKNSMMEIIKEAKPHNYGIDIQQAVSQYEYNLIEKIKKL